MSTLFGHVTRKLNEANNAVQYLEGMSFKAAEEKLSKCSSGLETAFEKYEGAVMKFMTICTPDDFQAAETRANKLRSDVDKAMAELYKAMGKLKLKTPESVNLDSLSRVHRPNEALKPAILGLSNTPAQYRQWKLDFKTYYTSSQMDKCTLEEQKAYFFQLLEQNLALRLQPYIPIGMEIFNENGILQEVDKLFTTEYPLFNRRWQFLQCVQKGGQSYHDWKSEIMTLSQEADLQNIKTDDLITLVLMQNIRDVNIKKEWFKQKDPTIEDLDRVAEAELASARTRNNGAQVCLVKGGAKKKTKQEDKCQYCGKGPHDKDKCPARKDGGVICKKCNKKGHYAKVCKGSKKATTNKEESNAKSS